MIVLLLFFTSCSEGGSGSSGSTAEDGTVTVEILTSPNGITVTFGLFADGADPQTADFLAAGSGTGTGGTLSVTLEASDGAGGTTGSAWTGTGGTSYDIYIISDEDSSGTESGPSSGDYYLETSVTVDGNTTVTKTYSSDFTQI